MFIKCSINIYFFTVHDLCAWHCAKHLTRIISFGPTIILYVQFFFLFLKWGTRVREVNYSSSCQDGGGSTLTLIKYLKCFKYTGNKGNTFVEHEERETYLAVQWYIGRQVGPWEVGARYGLHPKYLGAPKNAWVYTVTCIHPPSLSKSFLWS